MEEVINTSAESLAEDKLRARAQWGADPCGAVHGQEFEFGSREFFDEVERHRYTEYAPWMREVMGFDKFPGAKLLEIGCGMGSDLLQFARGGAIVTGADLTPRSVETSKHRFKIYDQPGTFVLTDGERLPFTDASFDVVYSNGVLHHTPDTEGAVREVHRVLRPDGTAKVMLYYRNSLNYWAEMFLRRGVLTGEIQAALGNIVGGDLVVLGQCFGCWVARSAAKLQQFGTCRQFVQQQLRVFVPIMAFVS